MDSVKTKKVVQGAVGVIRSPDNLFLISKRPEHTTLAGLWEFPGGKLDEGETAKETVIRELSEEVGITVLNAESFHHIYYDYPDFSVDLAIFLVDEFLGVGEGLEGQEVQWVTAAEFEHYNFVPASLSLLKKIKEFENIQEMDFVT